jgi:subtilase family serine protease
MVRKIVLFVVLLVHMGVCVEEFWMKQHCSPADGDVLNFQVYLKWNNDEILTSFVQSGSTENLPFSHQALTTSEELMSFWRFTLKPSQQAFDTVMSILYTSGVTEGLCRSQWDSIHCTGVPVSVASRVFGVEICAYKQNLATMYKAAPYLSRNRLNGLFWLCSSNSSPLIAAFPQAKYVGGISMFDPTSVPVRRSLSTPKADTKIAETLDPSLWPINTGSNGPVIISGLGLPEFGSLSDFGAMTVAVNCKNGAPSNASSASWCPEGMPANLTVKVAGQNGSATIPLSSEICGSYGTALTNITAWQEMVVCNFEAHQVVVGLETWGRYEVTATTTFFDGSISSETTMMNFWSGEYQTLMEVTIPNPMTPKDIRELYAIPESEMILSNLSAQGILEFSDTLDPRQGFLVSDLRTFLVQYGVVNESNADAYLAEYLQEVGTSLLESRGETSLDIEMMMSLARGAKTYLWNVINGPGQQYIHWAQAFIGWAHNVTSGEAPSSALPPSVWSVSYGGGEWNTTSDSLTEANILNDYFKLMTASGVTMVVSSGDSGAGFETMAPLVSYPASSPYVVSVGATANRLHQGVVVQAACSAADGNVITTGGAFSQYFDVPEYQAEAVKAYVDAHPGFPSAMMSSSQRAVPDIATIGAWVNVVFSNSTIPVFGTSIAAPVLSSMISLANDKRRIAGYAPVALANWMIYSAWSADSTAFDDVTLGSNCAGEQSAFPANFPTYSVDACFNATIGWDPVSGVGSPRYPAFKSIVLQWNITTSSPSKSHTGAIVGGVVGGVVGAAVLAFVAYRLYTRPADDGEYTKI